MMMYLFIMCGFILIRLFFPLQLSHYLDIVEVLIAQQVSAKSDAFFDAMTSHDALMEQLSQTISTVQMLRKKIREIENNLVKESFLVMRANRSRNNQRQVLKKVCL